MKNTISIVSILAAVAVVGCLSTACDPAPKACQKNYDPVCATFTKTFSNECELEANLCRLAKEGFEFTEETHSGDCCNRVCTLEHTNTCGSDGTVYSNMCMLKTARCQKRDWITAVTPEYCPDFPEPIETIPA